MGGRIAGLSNRRVVCVGVMGALFSRELAAWTVGWIPVRTLTGLELYGALVAGLSGLLVVAALRWEGGRVSEIGLMRASTAHVAPAVAVFVGLWCFDAWLAPPLASAAGLGWNVENLDFLAAIDDAAPGWLVFFGSAVVAPVVEEIVYRGYLYTRLTALTRRPWLACLISSAFFASAHVFYGSVRLVDTFVFGIAMTVLFVRARSLWPCIGVHALHNGSLHLGLTDAHTPALIACAVAAYIAAMFVDACRRPSGRYGYGAKPVWLLAYPLSGLTVVGPVIVAVTYDVVVRRARVPERRDCYFEFSGPLAA